MKEMKKKYDKAIQLFQSGQIDEALAICEKLISENLKNIAALNLKGLLLYIKGDLKAAETAWKINKDFNNDQLAKGYLKDIEKDKHRLELYEEALKDIKSMYIKDAEEKLLICSESDFNKLNVNNALAFCCIKKGEYGKAKEYIATVIEIDKKNKVALDNNKTIKEFSGESNFNINFRYVAIAVAVVCIISIGYFSYKPISSYFATLKAKSEAAKTQNTKENANETKTNPSYSKNNTAKEESQSEESKKAEQVKFPVDEVNAAISQKNYEKLYDTITAFDKSKLNINDKVVYDSGEQMLKSDGVGNFYDTGRSAFNSSDFGKANIEFQKAFRFSKDSYLNPHIIYMLATTNEKLGDYEKSLSYYDQYVNSYYGGDYTAQCLYKLATINSNSDMNKAKQYAQKIATDFKTSMYYNSTIKGILSAQ